MDRPGRQFLCARCRKQVVLCSRCDRGNRYCGRACRRQARDDARRETASRYQRSYRGRLTHAARSRRWRQRRAEAAQNVTHQGSQAGAADAPLAAWTHDIATVSAVFTVSAVTTVAADAQDSTALPPDPDPQTQPCRRCRRSLGLLVRLGFLRHGLRTVMPAGRRHDHSP
jgi:hypothetical protein